VGFKIDIAWQGDPRHDRQGLRRRALPLVQFLPLGRLPGVHLHSLQKRSGVEQIEQVAHLFPVTDLGSRLAEGGGAFLDTAVMKNLDLEGIHDVELSTQMVALPDLRSAPAPPVELAAGKAARPVVA
jgi:hypothetical protein